MLGHLNPRDKNITVVGSGVSGLIAASFLIKQGYKVRVIDEKERSGGLIDTLKTPYGMVETAAHSLLVSPKLREFFDEMQVPLVEAKTRKRFIFRKGKMRKWPLGIFESISFFLRLVFKKAKPSYKNMRDFGEHHLGKAGCEHLLQPFVNGIYASSVDRLSLTAIFPKLKMQEGKTFVSNLLAMKKAGQKKGGGKKGKNAMLAPKGGMHNLVEKLTQYVQEHGTITLSETVDSIPSRGNVLLCVPARRAAKLLKSDHPELSDLLEQVEYQSLVTATVFYEKKGAAAEVEGVGVLHSPEAGCKGLGILFSSSTFPGRVADEKRHISLSVILGGDHSPDMVDRSDAAIERFVREDVEEVLGITAAPVDIVITRWPRGLPLYSSELEALHKELSSKLPEGLALFGNYTGSMSIRQMIEYWQEESGCSAGL